MDLLALLLPVALVAADVLQVLVHVDVVGADDLLGLIDDVARQADLVGDLEGERRARASQLEAEQGPHLAAVVEHGTVDDAGCLVGEELQVGVVGGDDAVHLQVVELAEDSLSDGAADLGLGARTELIDEDERAARTRELAVRTTVAIGIAQHELHVLQVARIGRKVVVDALFVADIDKDVVEDGHLGVLLHGHGQAVLQHVLHETERLEAHRLAARVGTGDESDALLLVVEQDVEGHHGAVGLPVAQIEQRMTGLHPVGDVLLGKAGHDAVDFARKTHLGLQEVNLAQEVVAAEQIVNLGTDEVGDGGEDADDLLSLLALEFADVVVGLHHFGGLHKDGLARGGLVVDDAAQLSLGGCRNGDDQTAVAHGRCRVLIDHPFGLGVAEDAVEQTTYRRKMLPDVPPDLGQVGTGIVAYLAVGCQRQLDLTHQGGEGHDVLRQRLQKGEALGETGGERTALHGIGDAHLLAFAWVEIAGEGLDGAQASQQVEQVGCLHVGACQPYPLEGRSQVEEAVGGERLGGLFDERLHLGKQGKLVLEGTPIGHERHGIGPLGTQRTERSTAHHAPDLVESELLFKVLWIDQCVGRIRKGRELFFEHTDAFANDFGLFIEEADNGGGLVFAVAAVDKHISLVLEGLFDEEGIGHVADLVLFVMLLDLDLERGGEQGAVELLEQGVKDGLVGDADAHRVAAAEHLGQLETGLEDEGKGTGQVLLEQLELAVGDAHIFGSLGDVAADDGQMAVLLLLLAVLVDLLDRTLVEGITTDGIDRIGGIDHNAAIAYHLGDVLQDAGVGIICIEFIGLHSVGLIFSGTKVRKFFGFSKYWAYFF